MSATIKYNGSTIASVEDGKSVELDTQGKYMSGNVTVEAAGGGGGGAKTVTITASLETLAWVGADGVAHYEESPLVNPVSRECLSGSLVFFNYSILEPGTTLSVSNATRIAAIDNGSRANHRYSRIYQVD